MNEWMASKIIKIIFLCRSYHWCQSRHAFRKRRSFSISNRSCILLRISLHHNPFERERRGEKKMNQGLNFKSGPRCTWHKLTCVKSYSAAFFGELGFLFFFVLFRWAAGSQWRRDSGSRQDLAQSSVAISDFRSIEDPSDLPLTARVWRSGETSQHPHSKTGWTRLLCHSQPLALSPQKHCARRRY